MAIRLNYQTAALKACLDQMENGIICGRIASQRLYEPTTFSGINDFCSRVNILMDIQRFPQAFRRARSFTGEQLKAVRARCFKKNERL